MAQRVRRRGEDRSGTVDDVRAMYEKFPYPSPLIGSTLIEDVASSLKLLFGRDDLAGRRVLDAGCGSGQRLLGAARAFPKVEFWGVDMTSASLDAAKRLAAKHAIKNVRFQQSDLLHLRLEERFDIVISTGVVVCLEDPLRGLTNLASLLTGDGMIYVWLYHSLGEHQRMLDRELARTLWQEGQANLASGVELLEDLGLRLDARRYGSSSAAQTDENGISQTSLDVDAYLHPIVHTYRFGDAVALLSRCGVDWVAVNGFNTEGSSRLLDICERARGSERILCLQVSELFEKERLQARYRRLSALDKLKAIELRLKPTGFTMLAGRGSSLVRMGPRIEGNRVTPTSETSRSL